VLKQPGHLCVGGCSFIVHAQQPTGCNQCKNEGVYPRVKSEGRIDGFEKALFLILCGMMTACLSRRESAMRLSSKAQTSDDNMVFRPDDNMVFRPDDNMVFRPDDNMVFRPDDNMVFRPDEKRMWSNFKKIIVKHGFHDTFVFGKANGEPCCASRWMNRPAT
jgi:hypothetical protein